MPAHKPTKPITVGGLPVAVEPVKAAAAPFNWQRYRKLIVGAAGLAASLLAQGLIPNPYAHYIAAVLAGLTAVGIYQASNDKPADPEAGEVSWGAIVAVLLVAILLAIVFGWHASSH